MITATDLLAMAERYGIEMIPAGDRIRLRAPAQPPPEVLETLRAHKQELLHELSGAAVSERAAIQEHDGGLSRHEAEHQARNNIRVYRYRITDHPDQWPYMLAPGLTLDEVEGLLRQRYGDRLIEVRITMDALLLKCRDR